MEEEMKQQNDHQIAVGRIAPDSKGSRDVAIDITVLEGTAAAAFGPNDKPHEAQRDTARASTKEEETKEQCRDDEQRQSISVSQEEWQEMRTMMKAMQEEIADLKTKNAPEKAKIQRQQSTLIIPDDDKFSHNTVSLNRDIYMAYIVLHAYGFWEEMSRKDRRNFWRMLIVCMIMQGGTLSLLLVEMIIDPPWDSSSSEGSSILVLTTKAFAMMCFSLYIWKDILNLWQTLRLRRPVPEFSVVALHGWYNFSWFFTVPLYLAAMALSVGLISTSETGFDAVLNAVGITFVLEIDDWMYYFINSHVYIQDELFDVKYERPKQKQVSTGTVARRHYFCCVKSVKSTDPTANEIPEISRRFTFIFPVFLLCLDAFAIFAGFHYGVPIISIIGIIIASVVAVVVGLGVVSWMSFFFCCFQPNDRKERQRYWGEVIPTILNKYEIDVDNLNKDDEAKFVTECMNYAYDNYIGCGSDLRRKQMLREEFKEHILSRIVNGVHNKSLEELSGVTIGWESSDESNEIAERLVAECVEYAVAMFPNDEREAL